MSTMAGIVQEHGYAIVPPKNDISCYCGEQYRYFRDHAEHVADALTKAGYGDPAHRAVVLGAALAYDAIEASAIQQAKADAWDEGWQKGYEDCDDPEAEMPFTPNPYRSES